MSAASLHWRRNMYVCLFGSFTNVMAMTLLLPFLPIYVEQLGVKSHAAIVQWSGIAYGVSYPRRWRAGAGLGTLRRSVWTQADPDAREPGDGDLHVADRRVAEHLAAGRACGCWPGLLGGYASGAVVLVATQTPKERAGWALGMLSTGTMAGTLLGPLIGGVLPGLIGIARDVLPRGRRDLPGVHRDVRADPGRSGEHSRADAAGGGRLVDDPGRAAGDRDAVHRDAADAGEHVDRADHHGLCRATGVRRARGLHSGRGDGGLGGRERAGRAVTGAAGRPDRHVEPGDRSRWWCAACC